MSDEIMACWQADIIFRALAASVIDEGEAVLLAALYYHSNWTTRVISDFRAERACEWLGRDSGYVFTMRKRLKALREAGWFTSTYKKGVKLPYDVVMCAAATAPGWDGAPQAPGAPCILLSNTLGVKNESQSTGETTTKATQTVTGTPCLSQDACGAPLHIEAAALRSAVYTTTDGELLDRALTPSQIDILLGRHTVAEIAYALGKRVDKVRDRRELHRSLRTFLMDGGVQIELYAAQAWLKEHLEWANGWYISTAGKVRVRETPAERIERITKQIDAAASELSLFPNLTISGDAGEIIAQRKENI